VRSLAVASANNAFADHLPAECVSIETMTDETEYVASLPDELLVTPLARRKINRLRRNELQRDGSLYSEPVRKCFIGNGNNCHL
jgi:hypothetical protein